MSDIITSSKINTKKSVAPAVKQGSYRQLMSPVHTWFGLLMGWLLYLVFFMGTLSYFKEEITLWATPAIVSSTTPTTDDVLIWAAKQAQHDYPNAQSITAKAADGRTPLTVTIRGEKRSDRETLILANDGMLTKASTWSRGGDFFYHLHYNLHYMDAITARWIVGFASVMMFVAIITGVIVHKKIFTDFFTFRRKKGQRSWLDAHNSLSVLPLPYHIMITFTGIVTLVGLYLPYSEKVAKLPDDAYAQVSSFKKGKKDDTPAPYLADMNALATTAKTAWQVKGDYTLSSVRIDNLGKTGSSTIFELATTKQLSKIAPFISFDRTGKMEGQTGIIPSGVALQNAMIGLHRANFADLWLRYLFFALGMAGTAMIASGLVLWTVKRRTDYTKQSYLGFKLVESLNIAAIAGLPVATATFLWANRLLPTLKDRADTEISLFFTAWAVCTLLAIGLPKKRAWIVLFWLSTALFALLPLVNAITTDRGFVTSVIRGDFVFVAMDVAFIGFAWLFWHIGKRVQTHSDKPKHPKKPPKKAPAIASLSTNVATNKTVAQAHDTYKKGGYG